jgi:hypothetical protein
MCFKQNRYILRKPVPGFEPGTGGFKRIQPSQHGGSLKSRTLSPSVYLKIFCETWKIFRLSTEMKN